MKSALLAIAVLPFVTSPLTAADSPQPVKLTQWQTPEHAEAVPRFPAIRQNRAFLEEILPSLFTRTLEIDIFELPNEGVKWVFTGPRAGITVAIRPGEVEMTARCYDSSALYPDDVLGGRGNAARFPEKQRPLCKIPFEGNLKALTLDIDHRAAAELFLNGRSVHRAHFPEDLSRHQLQLGEVIISGLTSPLTTAERTSATQPNLIDPTFDPAAPVLIHPGEILTLTNAPLGLATENP